ncbi:hypothetical protein D4R99_04595 [bacterium]|nr:MAG: hypothetical protein D4R99_04595 [bacterium]
MMKFSEETTEKILDIKEFSNGKLGSEFELSALIESASKSGKQIYFDKLIFTAKFLKGLKSVMAKNVNDKVLTGKYVKEFSDNLEVFKDCVKIITSDAEDIIKDMFRKKYLEVTQESMNNAVLLIDDLALCKDYYNSKR